MKLNTKTINTIAWWIPVSSWRDKFRAKYTSDKKIKFKEDEYIKVLSFFKNHQNFRTLHELSKETGFDIEKCRFYKSQCYAKRDIGMYFFEADAAPQAYMEKYIIEKLGISNDAKILEIAPGNCPIFDFNEYKNWIGVDKNYKNNMINFDGRNWAKNKYPQDKIFPVSWENLSELSQYTNSQEKYDLIVSSHSFEHVFEPIKSLIESFKLLKTDGGYIVLFVPDGFSDEPATRSEMTHTLYMVPDMIKEFFHYANAYTLQIEVFRPNYDYVIIATRR